MSKTKKSEFRPDDFVVYPAHGVGKIVSIEEQEVAGMKLEMFVISFEKDKMTLRVPTARATENRHAQHSQPRPDRTGAGDAEGQGPRQTRHVVAPGAGI